MIEEDMKRKTGVTMVTLIITISILAILAGISIYTVISENNKTVEKTKELKKEIAEGRFREDLYHRLAVILIRVPSLNERRDDIPLLIDYFSAKIAEEQGISPKKFSKKAIELLQKQDWTGNIRELRNVVERLIILGGKEISEDDVKAFAGK